MLMADIDYKVKSFHHIPADSMFPVFVTSVKMLMKCHKLSKKLIEWFNCEGRDAVFSFRFRGEESGKYLKHFPQMIAMLLKNTNVLNHHERLIQFFFQSLLLRKLVSYSVRILGLKSEVVDEMEHIGLKLFKCCCIHDRNITPSLWTFTNVAPVHTKWLVEKMGLGLGVNSMEGREQKHQKIFQYMKNSTAQEKWENVFRHEFISCVYLRENGFDQ